MTWTMAAIVTGKAIGGLLAVVAAMIVAFGPGAWAFMKYADGLDDVPRARFAAAVIWTVLVFFGMATAAVHDNAGHPWRPAAELESSR